MSNSVTLKPPAAKGPRKRRAPAPKSASEAPQKPSEAIAAALAKAAPAKPAPAPSEPQWGAHPLLRHFCVDGLGGNQIVVSGRMCDMAYTLDAMVPDGPEKDAGLRKLLEARDCMVRAAEPEKPPVQPYILRPWKTHELTEKFGSKPDKNPGWGMTRCWSTSVSSYDMSQKAHVKVYDFQGRHWLAEGPEWAVEMLGLL